MKGIDEFFICNFLRLEQLKDFANSSLEIICAAFSIQRPPVVKQAAVKVAFYRSAPAITDSPAGFSLDPSLAIAVLGILDVLA